MAKNEGGRETRPGLTKLVFITWFFFDSREKLSEIRWLYIIFKYGWETVPVDNNQFKQYDTLAFLMNDYSIQMSDNTGSTTESAVDKGSADNTGSTTESAIDKGSADNTESTTDSAADKPTNNPANHSSQDLNQDLHEYVILIKFLLQ